MQDIEKRVKNYWTNRVHDFSTVRRNELKAPISGRWMEEMNHYLPKNRKLDILDVGTGTGYFAVLLAKQGHRLTGIDLTFAMLNEAAVFASLQGVEISFIPMDAQRLDFLSASFDAVVTRNLTWTLPDPETAYAEWRRVLRPGGVLLNFDANYGNNVRNNQKKKSHDPQGCVYGHCGITPEMKKENAAITLSMSISYKKRPEWDVECLRRCGFAECGCDESAGQRILRDKDLADAPLFLAWAKA
ncbi:MAG: class I SAM-dependent methyltransferase [Dethiobacteria bacterium]|jgi:ubiquinone/menaquinone biosynthesis C-methylase UbiE